MIARSQIVACARRWVGTPWRHQGRGAGGIDCAGLPIAVAAELGLAQVQVGGYGRQPDGRTLRALCRRYMTPIAIGELAPGDVVTLRFPNAAEESHLAMVVDHPRRGLGLVHALNARDGNGRVVEHGLDSAWRARITAAYRLPGVEA